MRTSVADALGGFIPSAYLYQRALIEVALLVVFKDPQLELWIPKLPCEKSYFTLPIYLHRYSAKD